MNNIDFLYLKKITTNEKESHKSYHNDFINI